MAVAPYSSFGLLLYGESVEAEIFVIAFNARAELLTDTTRAVDLNQLNDLKPNGTTALYDAVYLGAEKLERARYSKRAILLISDGEENDSHHNFKELKSLLSESGLLLYSICVSDPINLTGKAGMRVQDRLNRFDDVTGGSAFYASSVSEMDEVFDHIALELRHQYSIGYRQNNPTSNGKWHKITIKVAQDSSSHYRVRTRDGYSLVKNFQH